MYRYGVSRHQHGEIPQPLPEEQEGECPDPSWVQHSCLFDEQSSAVTAVAYDGFAEMLWTAHASGRLTSYVDQTSSSDQMEKYSSFSVADSPVINVYPALFGTVMSVSATSIKMHTIGGARLGEFVNYDPSNQSEPTPDFTAAHVLQNHGETDSTPLALIAGTSSRYLNIYDLNIPGPPLSLFDVEAPTVKVQSSPLYVAVAGSDGMVRLMDVQLRSQHVIHTLPAHSGSVLDLSLPVNSYYMATCGMSGRAINPYDPKSPYIYSPDPVVQIFDLRMPDRGIPVSAGSAVPSFVCFLPSAQRAIRHQCFDEENLSPSLMAVSTDGYLQILPLMSDDPNLTPPVIFAPVSEMGLGDVSSVAVSSSGRRIALGTTGGGTAQMRLQHTILPEEEKDAQIALESDCVSYAVGVGMVAGRQMEPIINLKSDPIDVPRYPQPAVPRAVDIEEPNVSTTYALLSRNPRCLASSFSATPKMLNTRMRIPGARKINESLLSATTFQEFIGFVPNPGFPENSMIYGPSRSEAYEKCDPRFMPSGDANKIDISVTNNRDSAFGKSQPVSGVGSDANEIAVPIKYRRVRSHRGREKMKQFNYEGFISVDNIVGLENSIERPWVNPMLQFLYSIPRFRQSALESQMRPFHCIAAPYSILCELGLLFHMMNAVSSYSNGSNGCTIGVAVASNFHTIFQHSSAAAAVGLLKDTLIYSLPPGGSSHISGADFSHVSILGQLGLTTSVADSSTAISVGCPTNNFHQTSLSAESYSLRLQQNLQTFVKFMLTEMSSEFESELKYNNAQGTTARSGRIGASILDGKSFKSVSASLISDAVSSSPSAKAINIVDELFGITVHTTTTFLHSGSVDEGSSHRTFTLELVYPPVLSVTSSSSTASGKFLQAAKADQKKLEDWLASCTIEYTINSRTRWTSGFSETVPSFCAIMWSSLQKELYMRGWCSSSETYEPFKQIKSVDVSGMPDVLAILCGDTLPTPVSSTTPVNINVDSTELNSTFGKEKDTIADLWRSRNLYGGPWLSCEIEIFKLPAEATFAERIEEIEAPATAIGGYLFVSEKLQHHEVSGAGGNKLPVTDGSEWLIYNGISYISSSVPASVLLKNAFPGRYIGDSFFDPTELGQTATYELLAIISHIDHYIYTGKRPGVCGRDGNDICSHPVLHLRRPVSPSKEGIFEWILLNDFAASSSNSVDAASFTAWRHPDAIFFNKKDANHIHTSWAEKDRINLVIPISSLATPSLSSVQSLSPVPIEDIPLGTLISRDFVGIADKELLQPQSRFVAFDAEFVTVQVDEEMHDVTGKQVIGREGRQVRVHDTLLLNFLSK